MRPAKMGSELQRMFIDVVTPPPGVLRICVGVLRDVTVLATGPPSLGYELRTRNVCLFGRSRRCRSVVVRRPFTSAVLHSFEVVSRRFVPKSVPKYGKGSNDRRPPWRRRRPQVPCSNATSRKPKNRQQREVDQDCPRVKLRRSQNRKRLRWSS